MTGLPTVLGWVLHERQFRGSSPEVDERAADVAALYGCQRRDGRCERLPDDRSRVRGLLAKYRIDYVYVGPSEREAYGPDADRFAGLLEVAYRNASVVVY